MSNHTHRIGLLALPLLVGAVLFFPLSPSVALSEKVTLDRSPVDLLLTRDESRLITANQTTATVSLVDLASDKILAEIAVGNRPSALALTPDGATLLVSATYSGDVTFVSVEKDKLTRIGSVNVSFEPRGIAVSPDGKLAYVALTYADAVAVLDVGAKKEVTRIPVGKWPRYLALSSDGKRLAVGVNGDGGVAVVDTTTRKKVFLEDFVGLNLGQMQISADNKYVYFPWIVYGHNPITTSNIQQGWVLASRIARVQLDKKARREAIALDPRGKAVGDPHGLALSPDEKRLVCAASGTQELLVFRLPGLPFVDYGGPGDHIDADLLKDRERFSRIDLGGRPMAVRFGRDGKTVYVANYLRNSVQVVDIESKKITREIALGGPEKPSLNRQGEAIFYDAKRSLDQWYSCHSCHYEGGTNAQAMDTFNDGRARNFKTILPLEGVSKTSPWFWHGVEKDLPVALRKSLTGTLLGKRPSDDDVRALGAYFASLDLPANPHLPKDGKLSESAARGKQVFQSTTAGCSRCHPAPTFTDGKVHEVGTGDRGDFYKGYNPPSLRGLYRRVLFLHDGRSRDLDEVLRKHHSPEKVTGRGELTDKQRADLLEYLRSL